MPTTVLYRINSGEVWKINVGGQLFSDRDTAYFGVLTDPTFTDGMQLRESLPGGDMGPLRVSGFAKWADPGGNSVRNATQAEINGFETVQDDDEAQMDADEAGELLKNHPRWRKFTMLMFKAMNRIRTDAGLPAWSKPQIVTFIDNNLSKDD